LPYIQLSIGTLGLVVNIKEDLQIVLHPLPPTNALSLQWVEFITTCRNDKENSTELGREHTHGARNTLPLRFMSLLSP
ncbi:hypothetical protein ACQP3J_30130, partial [Escherichia coli]